MKQVGRCHRAAAGLERRGCGCAGGACPARAARAQRDGQADPRLGTGRLPAAGDGLVQESYLRLLEWKTVRWPVLLRQSRWTPRRKWPVWLDQSRWTPAAEKLPVCPRFTRAAATTHRDARGFQGPADGLSANTGGLLDARASTRDGQFEDLLSCRVAQDVARAGDRTCILGPRPRLGRAQLIAGLEVSINCRFWVSPRQVNAEPSIPNPEIQIDY